MSREAVEYERCLNIAQPTAPHLRPMYPCWYIYIEIGDLLLHLHNLRKPGSGPSVSRPDATNAGGQHIFPESSGFSPVQGSFEHHPASSQTLPFKSHFCRRHISLLAHLNRTAFVPSIIVRVLFSSQVQQQSIGRKRRGFAGKTTASTRMLLFAGGIWVYGDC